MKRKLPSSDERLEKNLKDPAYRAAYIEALAEEVSGMLRSLREGREESQEVIAGRMGINRSRVSQIESTDGKGMTLETVARYAQAVGYSAALIFEDTTKGGIEIDRVYLTPDPSCSLQAVVSNWEIEITATQIRSFEIARPVVPATTIPFVRAA